MYVYTIGMHSHLLVATVHPTHILAFTYYQEGEKCLSVRVFGIRASCDNSRVMQCAWVHANVLVCMLQLFLAAVHGVQCVL